MALRARAEHVIVLMLENRSFDHVLGLLDHPRRAESPRWWVEPGQWPNPRDLAAARGDDPTVTDDGTTHLPTGPPHHHRSAVRQLNRGARGFEMNGFVAAYADELAGKSSVKVRWDAVFALVVTAVAPLAAAVLFGAALRADKGWGSFPLAMVVGATLAGAMVIALRLHRLPGVRRRWLVTAWMGLTLAASFALGGFARSPKEPTAFLRWWAWCAAALVAAVLVLRWVLQRRHDPPCQEVQQRSGDVMRCLRSEERAPALAWLAKEYAVCVRWFSSVPGATWPNRNFAHAGTADEAVDIELAFFRDRTIFQVLDDARRAQRGATKPDWRIYFHDTPQVFAYDELWRGRNRANWYDASKLLKHIEDETLPTYAFVEPCHRGERANSQHPERNLEESSEDFRRGDMLIASIYNALVSRPDLMQKTVFVITYDEHGGFFDHAPPPKAVHPEPPGSRTRGREFARRLTAYFVEYDSRPFPFTHLGARVPAVVVSPWIERHTVDDTVYDHASIPATLRRLWAPDQPPLSRRERHANDILPLLAASKSRRTVTPCDVYDDVPGGAEAAAVGCPIHDMELDVAATGDPDPTARVGDDFSTLLDGLNHAVRAELIETATFQNRNLDAAAPVPTAGLFKQSADSTRNGNPAYDDL